MAGKPEKRQIIRKNILLFMFLLFPFLYYYLSPYLIIIGASEGIVTGSFVIFGFLFLVSLFLGRTFCGWLCPGGGEQEICSLIKNKRFKVGKLDWIKYLIWVPWLFIIGLMFYQAGGIRNINFFYHTFYGISVYNLGSVMLFVIIAAVIAVLSLTLGRRGFCHTLCWMAPFMIVGRRLSHFSNLPALRLESEKEKCIHCKICSQKCPMSLDVYHMVQIGNMEHSECILCGNCIDVCPENVIKYTFNKISR